MFFLKLEKNIFWTYKSYSCFQCQEASFRAEVISNAIDVAKSLEARPWIDGAHNNSNKSYNILLHHALSAPSIHARALKDLATSINFSFFFKSYAYCLLIVLSTISMMPKFISIHEGFASLTRLLSIMSKA